MFWCSWVWGLTSFLYDCSNREQRIVFFGAGKKSKSDLNPKWCLLKWTVVSISKPEVLIFSSFQVIKLYIFSWEYSRPALKHWLNSESARFSCLEQHQKERNFLSHSLADVLSFFFFFKLRFLVVSEEMLHICESGTPKERGAPKNTAKRLQPFSDSFKTWATFQGARWIGRL